MSRRKGPIKSLTDLGRNTADKLVDSGGKVVTTTKNLTTHAQRKLLESGAKGKKDAVQSQISGKFDEISGQAMYQLVQERLAEQDRFNDLLATKLHEALERISDLEKRLADE
ncbi:MAG: hypothetical protein IIB30_02825 [Chloroflexi bacterium]|nr:hypothetical protein [Chloroflexota bacterium]